MERPDLEPELRGDGLCNFFRGLPGWRCGSAHPRAALVAVAVLLGFVAAYQFETGHVTDNPVFRLAILRAVLTFVAGVFLHVVSRRLIMRQPNAIAWLCCAGIVACTAIPQAGLLMPFAFAGLILLSTYSDVTVTRLLSGRLSMFLGKISFSLYLVHYTMLWWLAWLFETGRLSARHAWLDVVCVFDGRNASRSSPPSLGRAAVTALRAALGGSVPASARNSGATLTCGRLYGCHRRCLDRFPEGIRGGQPWSPSAASQRVWRTAIFRCAPPGATIY